MEKPHIEESRFFKAGLAGSSREIGAVLAREILAHNSEYAEFLKTRPFEPDARYWKDFDELYASCEAACPGIGEEIAGFAGELGVAPEAIAFWNFTALKGANCSHAAILPSASANGHPLVIRSYEWNPWEDDLTLASTAVTGSYRHIGCTGVVFGRMDGMNEEGLSVTMSGGMAAGLPQDWHYKKGLNFWIVIRGLLERCRDITDAKSFLLEHLPTGNHMFILADSSGKALLVEMQGGDLGFREALDGLLVETNHYTTAPLSSRNRLDFIMNLSKPRLDFLERKLGEARGAIDRESLQNLMAGRVPEGCFGPWYKGGFGTLWQSVYDLEDRRCWFCLGSPGQNPWQEVRFDLAPGFTREKVFFAMEE